MMIYFCTQDLWDIVNKRYIVFDDISTSFAIHKKESKENQLKDSQPLLALQMSLADEYFSRIMGAKTAKAT